MLNDEEAPFRVYSERQLSVSHFSWNPYMDLMSVLPLDTSSPSFAVYRLINDKHSNSPLLFSEKLPFPGTTTCWVPDKRGVSVGDSVGNVFVFDAEHQRTIELHKVHDCAISKLFWTSVSLPVYCIPSGYPSLPSIFAMPLSLDEPADSPVVCESLATSNLVTFLSVLSVSGKLSIYYGGSIPVCEISVSDLFGISSDFFDVSLSSDLRKIQLLSTNDGNTYLYTITSSILSLRLSCIISVCRLEARIHWLLKTLSLQLETISRTPLTGTALADYLTVVYSTRIRVIVTHLLLLCSELREMAENAEYSVLGLEICQVKLLTVAVEQLLLLDSNSDSTSAIKDCESIYVSILSVQRKAIGSRMLTFKKQILCKTKNIEMMDNMFTWIEEGNLHVYMNSNLTEFKPPENSVWYSAKFYRTDRICLLLVHSSGSCSLCLLSVSSFMQDSVVVSANYGFSAFLTVQQLPNWCANGTLCVSRERGLCSIYSEGQLLTLDLEQDGDDDYEDEDEDDEEEERQPDTGPQRKERVSTLESPEQIYISCMIFFWLFLFAEIMSSYLLLTTLLFLMGCKSNSHKVKFESKEIGVKLREF